MPEPNRPPWRIASDLDYRPIWWLIDQRVMILVQCDACHHERRWKPVDLIRLFGKVRGKTMAYVAPRLRCSGCRSNWLRISMVAGSVLNMGVEPEPRLP